MLRILRYGYGIFSNQGANSTIEEVMPSCLALLFSGNPNPPVFNSQVLSKTQTSYKISWVSESYSPIEEYRLLYRKLPVLIDNLLIISSLGIVSVHGTD